jgi:hypothetical protein
MPAQKAMTWPFRTRKIVLLCLAASALIALRPAALANNQQQDKPAAVDLRMATAVTRTT